MSARSEIAEPGAVIRPVSGRPVGSALALGAIFAVALSLRPSIISVGPILPSIITEFGLSHATAALLTSIPDLWMGVFALPTPWLARRFGRDPVLICALALLGAFTLGRAFVSGSVGLLSTTAGVGVGIAVTGALVAGFIKARFPSRAALLMGLYANRTAWIIAIFFACVNLLFYAIIAWTVPMLREEGLSPTRAGLVLATFTAVFTAANPVFGSLSRSIDRRQWLFVSAGLTLAGLTALAIAPLFATFVSVAVCAFGLGGSFMLGMTLPLDNTDSVLETNAWNAFVLMVGYVIAAAGPLMVGQLRDITGNFARSYEILGGFAVTMLALTPFLKPRLQQHQTA